MSSHSFRAAQGFLQNTLGCLISDRSMPSIQCARDMHALVLDQSIYYWLSFCPVQTPAVPKLEGMLVEARYTGELEVCFELSVCFAISCPSQLAAPRASSSRYLFSHHFRCSQWCSISFKEIFTYSHGSTWLHLHASLMHCSSLIINYSGNR